GRTTAAGTPTESSFTLIFLGGAGTAVMAMVLITVSRPRSKGTQTDEARYETRAMNHEWG
ncbi:MFS transporter, partial [Mycobacterium sp. ITM-2017-0098]